MNLSQKLEAGAIFFLLALNDAHDKPRLLENIVSIVYYAFLAYVILTKGKKLIYVATRDIFLLLFITLAIVSVLWSSNASSTINDYKFLIRTCLLGVYIAMKYTPKEQMRLFFWTYSMIVVASLIVILFIPSYGISEKSSAWNGIYGHKQMFGRNLGFAISLFMTNFLLTNKQKTYHQLMSAIFIFLTLILIIFSESKTSLILFIFSISMTFALKVIKPNKYGIILLMALIFVFSIITIFVAINYEYILVDVLGKDVALNGRLPLWQLSINKGLEQPWLGYGYKGFWTANVSDIVINNTWARSNYSDRSVSIFHAHNGLIDIFLQMGLVGLTLFILNIFNITKKIFSMIIFYKNVETFWMLQFVAIFFIANLSESDIIPSSSLFWIIFVSTTCSSGLHLSRLQKQGKLI